MADELPSKRAKMVQSASTLSSAAAAAPSAISAGDSPSASSSAAAIAVPSPLSIAQRCNRDCLSIILSFSQSIADVAAAARTCHSWRVAASLRQSCCRAERHLSGGRRDVFLQMLESPLCVHLTWLTVFDAVLGVNLIQLHDRCSQLEDLDIRVDGASIVTLTDSDADASEFNAHAWPSSLRSLEIRTHKATSIGLQPLLNALPSSAIGLQSLSLSIQRKDGLDLTPLLRLPELASLRVYPELLSPSQLAVVRQLRSLTALDVAYGHWERKDLFALLADGAHQLQRLKKINIERVTLDVELMQALLTLTQLTELNPDSIDTDCFPLLRSFAQLRKLCLPSVSDALTDAAVSALLSSLRALSHLTSFQMNGEDSPPSPLHFLLAGLATAVPQLRELSLRSFDLPSLACLSAYGGQLRTLRLSACNLTQNQSVDDPLQLLRSLPHLECLDVRRCHPELSAAQRALLTLTVAAASLNPSLRSFFWE
jgi:hypothetical protein